MSYEITPIILNQQKSSQKTGIILHVLTKLSSQDVKFHRFSTTGEISTCDHFFIYSNH